ncbi:LysR family transcriptional regulator [Vibrio paucivorans]
MDIDLLKAFIALATTNTYREASEKLFITQSALTKKIQRLEDKLDCKLFERGRQGAHLTLVGETLLPDAQRVVEQFDNFKQLTHSVVDGTLGHLNIGFGISSYSVAPEIIALFKKHFPNVHITLNDTPSQHQHSALLSGEMHISFNRLPAEKPLKGEKIYSDRLVLAVHDEHTIDIDSPFASVKTLPYLALSAERGLGLHHQIQSYLVSQSVSLQPSQQSDDILTLLALVSARLGYTIVPESAKAISPPNVRFFALEGEHCQWDIGILYNASKQNPLREKFVDTALKHLQSTINNE